jgi:Bax protein
MKKIISYREKLLELVNIYRISEVKNYIKNKKKLTTPQIEHILKKNNVPIPTEINKSILSIYSKKITRPFKLVGETVNSFYLLSVKNILTFLNKIVKKINSYFIFVFESVLNFFSWISKSTLDLLNNAYNFRVEEKKVNKAVSSAIAATFVVLFIVIGFQVKDLWKDKKIFEQTVTKPKVEKKELVKNLPKPKVEKKEVVKIPEIKEKKSAEVKEFVLPDLNLKTETVLSLFSDVDYDLKKVRREKLVKPIYFTQFPKDLIEITNVQLKKETFIKIVLPLVVAENGKILDDRIKLNKITKKRVTTDKEKSWLRQKLKEYKVMKSSIPELKKRMDIIPISIAIAQAAKESGWGTSRFALEGNAIFGQWTWTGKGIEPLDRVEEMNHKILRFPILRASVKAYKNNLNTHKSYNKFREERQKLRTKKKSIEGIKLIHTLNSYAETGKIYTQTLAKMMEQNSLEDFEGVKLTNSVVKQELNL